MHVIIIQILYGMIDHADNIIKKYSKLNFTLEHMSKSTDSWQ